MLTAVKKIPVLPRVKQNTPAKEKLFLAVVPGKNLTLFLESLFTAHLLQKKNGGYRCEILLHSENAWLAEKSGIFSAVHPLSKGISVSAMLKKFKPHILYIPDPQLKTKITSVVGPGKIRIGGG